MKSVWFAILAVVCMVVSVACSVLRFNYASLFFLGMGVWMLVKDVRQDDAIEPPDQRWGD